MVILLEYQNIKRFLQKAMFQIDLKTFLWLKKLKTLCLGDMFLEIVKAKKLLEGFTKKNCKKTNQKEFRIEKAIKRMEMEKRKGYDSSFNSWIGKKDIV